MSVFVFLPLLLIGAALSVPLTPIFWWWQRRKKRLLADAVAKRGGLMAWEDFVRTADEKRGTLIVQGGVFKGPDLWWTADDIQAISPHPCSHDLGDRGREFRPFWAWCHGRYTNQATGCAFLVVGGGHDRTGFSIWRSEPGNGIFKDMPTVLLSGRRLDLRG